MVEMISRTVLLMTLTIDTDGMSSPLPALQRSYINISARQYKSLGNVRKIAGHGVRTLSFVVIWVKTVVSEKVGLVRALRSIMTAQWGRLVGIKFVN